MVWADGPGGVAHNERSAARRDRIVSFVDRMIERLLQLVALGQRLIERCPDPVELRGRVTGCPNRRLAFSNRLLAPLSLPFLSGQRLVAGSERLVANGERVVSRGE